MAGHRLSGDAGVRRCEEAGANVDDVALDHGFKEGMSNYCEPETVFQTGKRGEFFPHDMCDESPSLARRHAAGVRAYCSRANGYLAGTTGKKYNGICPADLEPAFVSEFNRGRKNYLSATIAENENTLRDLDVDIARLQSQRFMAQSRLDSLPLVQQAAVIVVDPYSGQQVATAAQPDAAVMARRNDLEMQIENFDSMIYSDRQKESGLRDTNRSLQVEMTVL